jgi:hypothetical protein
VVERLAEVWRSYDPGAAPRDPFTANPYLDICPPSLRDPSAADPAERARCGPRPRPSRRTGRRHGSPAPEAARWRT